MALVVADRVLETSTTTGTGAFTLAAAVTGYRRFSAVCSTNDTLYYAIVAVDGNGNPSGDWECGLGTYSSANTLTRTTPQASTNANAAVNFAAGTKQVFLSATKNYMAHLTALTGLSLVQGDVLFHNGTQLQRLPAGSSGQFLKTLGAGADPLWATAGGSTGFGWDFSPPLASSFTLFSGDGTAATLTDNADVGLVITTGAAAATGVIRGGYKALPAVGTDFSVTMKITLNTTPQTQYIGAGMTMYESATGKSHNWWIFSDTASSTGAHLRRQTIAGTFSSETISGYPYVMSHWFKMARVGTNLVFSVSADGRNFITISTIAQTTYLTTAPDRIGPIVWLSHASAIPIASVQYWAQTGF